MYNLFTTAICLREKAKLIVSYEDAFTLDIEGCFATCLISA